MSISKMLRALRSGGDRGPSGVSDKEFPSPESRADEAAGEALGEPRLEGVPSLPPVLWEAPLVEGEDPREDLVHSVLAMADSGAPVGIWHSPGLGMPAARHDEVTAARLAALCCEPPGAGGYVSIRHATPESLERDENAGYCIGRTAVGTARVPAEWAQRIECLDEIWVPSAFSRMALAGSGVPESKIRVVPSALDEGIFGPQPSRPRVERGDGFSFVTVLGWEYLRGLDIVLEAYVREFRGGEKVSLVLVAPQSGRSSAAFQSAECGAAFWEKVEAWLLRRLRDRGPADEGRADYEDLLSAVADDRLRDELRREREVESRTAAEISEAVSEELKGRRSDVPPIVVVNRTLPKAVAARIYSACDAFVMAPRAEPWGRPFLESMAVGLPAIGTRWGGHLDFMSPDNSFLITVRALVDVQDDDELGRCGMRLAEADTEHLRELMRRAFDHRTDARERAARGAALVRARYSRRRVSALMAERLAAIAGDPGLGMAEAV